ncbi:DUF2935 domain-containing protein [Clostridium estertheticum]|nr:DUF2935 domain-containing protein [Clostridium estertheticum]
MGVHVLNILFEHRFWLQILGDHSRFIYNSLSPNEIDKISKANYFIEKFDALLYQARKDLTPKETETLTMAAYKSTHDLRNFKLKIISEQLTGEIVISQSPTFINHMVNELEEYLFILNQVMNNIPPNVCSLNYHMLWLPDGSGHAASISSTLDFTEKSFINEARSFSKTFDDLYLKAIEFSGFTKTGLDSFPALDDLNFTAEKVMLNFKKYLEILLYKISNKKTLGTLVPLVLDHMNREECYYLTKLATVSETKSPNCDPTKPRI